MAGGDKQEKPITLFYSYSHDDEELRKRLEKHLSVLRWNGLIAEWHDRNIDLGDEWAKEIDRNLASADIILLLVSASFLASNYCWSVEMGKALERHDRGEAKVVPVILRHCRWGGTPFAKLQAAPKDGKPVTSWPDQDEALDDVATRLERVVAELHRQRRAIEQAQRQAEEERQRRDAEEEQREALRRQREQDEAQTQAAPHPNPLPPGERERAPVQPSPISGEGGARRESDGRVRAAPKNGVTIGVDPRELPDFAVFRDVEEPWCPEMVALPAGEFLMGSPETEAGRNKNEGPQHRVTIGYRVALGRYPVTFAEYDHFCAATERKNPGDAGAGRGKRPVVNVTWRNAASYCEWLAKETGQPYRLPSEAEWEYACRAGTTTRYSCGDEITERNANIGHVARGFVFGGRTMTTLVGSYGPNPWGLYDMHGNVWEWVEDVWHDSYKGAPVDGSAWTDREGANSSSVRVGRGGSWGLFPGNYRSARRIGLEPDLPGRFLGFRLARTLD
jgi:formylglycine-generating enzyme required for sulfatase activity